MLEGKSRKKYFPVSSAITAAEGQALIDKRLVATQIVAELPKPVRKPPTCSNCKELGH